MATDKIPRAPTQPLTFIRVGNPSKRIVIHDHPRKTYGPKLLKALLADIGWSEADMRRVKLIN